MRRRNFLPLTPRGIFMFVISAAVLTAGILRADMAGLFWGSSFFLVILYAIAGNIVTRVVATRRRKDPGFLEVHLPAAVISPGEDAEAGVSAEIPRVLIPGFSVVFSLPLRWHERRLDAVKTALAPGRNAKAVRFKAEKRGSYFAAEALIQVRDVLGFTSSAASVPLEESVKVFPRVPRGGREIPDAEEGGDSVRFSRHRRRSTELLEVRKYFPGDDVRKLNWKVFAHAGELFLRIGEETPPPQSRFLFILDATANPAVPARSAADFLDGMVEECAYAMSVALSRGIEVSFTTSGSDRCRTFSEESRPDLMAELADVWWSPQPGWVPALPPRRRMHAVVFSSVGSPSLERILSALKLRGWNTSLVIRDLPLPPRRKPPSLKELLFVPMESA